MRQPFGGVGLSAYGPGVKAGGPHYVLALMQVEDANPDDDSTERVDDREPETSGHLEDFLKWLDAAQTRYRIGPGTTSELRRAIETQARAVQEEYSSEQDSVRLVGQDNIRRYRAIRSVTIRVAEKEELKDALISIAAAAAVGTQVTLSVTPDLHAATKETLESTADFLPGWVDPIEETDDQLAERIAEGHVNRLRFMSRSRITSPVEVACAEYFVTTIDEPVMLEGRIECLRYLDEQSISHDYHRYGNLGRRADEPRRAVM